MKLQHTKSLPGQHEDSSIPRDTNYTRKNQHRGCKQHRKISLVSDYTPKIGLVGGDYTPKIILVVVITPSKISLVGVITPLKLA